MIPFIFVSCSLLFSFFCNGMEELTQQLAHCRITSLAMQACEHDPLLNPEGSYFKNVPTEVQHLIGQYLFGDESEDGCIKRINRLHYHSVPSFYIEVKILNIAIGKPFFKIALSKQTGSLSEHGFFNLRFITRKPHATICVGPLDMPKTFELTMNTWDAEFCYSADNSKILFFNGVDFVIMHLNEAKTKVIQIKMGVAPMQFPTAYHRKTPIALSDDGKFFAVTGTIQGQEICAVIDEHGSLIKAEYGLSVMQCCFNKSSTKCIIRFRINNIHKESKSFFIVPNALRSYCRNRGVCKELV